MDRARGGDERYCRLRGFSYPQGVTGRENAFQGMILAESTIVQFKSSPLWPIPVHFPGGRTEAQSC